MNKPKNVLLIRKGQKRLEKKGFYDKWLEDNKGERKWNIKN